MSGWGCVHDNQGVCSRVDNRPCDPGMKGCVLAGRFRFTNPEKNRPARTRTVAAHEEGSTPVPPYPKW